MQHSCLMHAQSMCMYEMWLPWIINTAATRVYTLLKRVNYNVQTPSTVKKKKGTQFRLDCSYPNYLPKDDKALFA